MTNAESQFLCSFFPVLTSLIFYNGVKVQSAYVRHSGEIYTRLDNGNIETLAWAVVLDTVSVASDVAIDIDLLNQGQIGDLKNHFLFVHSSFNSSNSQNGNNFNLTKSHTTKYYALKDAIENKLNSHASVLKYHQQVTKRHAKRNLEIRDPAFKEQWHLVNYADPMYDVNVTGIWENGYAGTGITVCVVDDGLEWLNLDLRENYNPYGSWDLNGDDSDPSPEGQASRNSHGTRCAGEIAAAINDICGIGVAFNANISGLRALDGTITDSLEATAFTKFMQINDIYSCSWGPDDNGRMVEGPQYLASRAMEVGVNEGRNGYGSIYVVASGNGGTNWDNCNFDGYANSIYTLTIGAITEEGKIPFYAEECPAMLAVTFSSGISHTWDIVTTDWTKGGSGGCTKHHTGTSAAAPLAAGIVALMLQARACLFWRDIHYLVVLTALSPHETNSPIDGWHKNAAGLYHHNFYGFGRLDAWRLVTAAMTWESVPWQAVFISPVQQAMSLIPLKRQFLSLNYSVSKLIAAEYGLTLLEYVQVSISLKHPSRGRLMFWLKCPSGTSTLLTAARPKDNSTKGFKNWRFTTVRCWGEEPHGTWTLTLTDSGSSESLQGVMEDWQLLLYGTSLTTEEFMCRKRLVLESFNGESLRTNETRPCVLPQDKFPRVTPYSEKTLKILCLIGIFLLLSAVYEIFENACCYGDEKKRTARKMHKSNITRTGSQSQDSEIIPLVALQSHQDNED